MHANFFVSVPGGPLGQRGSDPPCRVSRPTTAESDQRPGAPAPQRHQREHGGHAGTVQRVLDQVVRRGILFGFTLAAGLVVLFAAVTATREERAREYAITRPGRPRQPVERRQRAELAGVACWPCAGKLRGRGGDWALARFVFEFTWTASPLVSLAVVWLVPCWHLLAGWWGLARCCSAPW